MTMVKYALEEFVHDTDTLVAIRRNPTIRA